ncbi:hypothetical protein L3Q82_007346 [Scortum barcoo]|uniref:Uncharacterized protein n=1 Tax=Scortum barcoo TaxID=214431 RepID=A0ACB8WS05_9TELE|nr:hypothetical protein L3Q82_007346 [Scortum barcoo]
MSPSPDEGKLGGGTSSLVTIATRHRDAPFLLLQYKYIHCKKGTFSLTSIITINHPPLEHMTKHCMNLRTTWTINPPGLYLDEKAVFCMRATSGRRGVNQMRLQNLPFSIYPPDAHRLSQSPYSYYSYSHATLFLNPLCFLDFIVEGSFVKVAKWTNFVTSKEEALKILKTETKSGSQGMELNCCSHVDRLLSKLPKYHRDGFIEYLQLQGKLNTASLNPYNLQDLKIWLQGQSIAVYHGAEPIQLSNSGKPTSASSKKPFKVHCLFCDSKEHYISRCPSNKYNQQQSWTGG